MAAVRLVQAEPAAFFTRDKFPKPPGFRLDTQGFRVGGTTAENFSFVRPLSRPWLVAASADRAVYAFPRQPLMPNRLEVNLAAPGFSAEFSDRLALRFTCEDSPRLTTPEVTVDAPNPTPPTRWVLVNFVEPQVPVLIVFPKPVTAILNGKAGDWQLSTLESLGGAVHFRLPLGTVKLKSQVADLGAAVHVIQEQEALWMSEAAHLVATSYALTKDGVKVTWKYDRPHALVPAFLCLVDPQSDITVDDEVVTTTADTEDAPQYFVAGTSLTAFFPCRPLLNSEPLVAGQEPLRLLPHVPVSKDPVPQPDYAYGLVQGSGAEERLLRTLEAANGAVVRADAESLGRGAVLNAAVHAATRWAEYRAERGYDTPTPKFEDPMKAVRGGAFGPAINSATEQALRSPVRVDGKGSLVCSQSGTGYSLLWKPDEVGGPLRIAAPWPLDVTDAKGVAKLEPKAGGDWFTLTVVPSGSEAQLVLILPAGKSLPKKA